jgi:outer membrane protein OmpA-like peptidoglycan-associated protein
MQQHQQITCKGYKSLFRYFVRAWLPALSVACALLLSACSAIDAPPSPADSGNTIKGVFAGGAAGAAVGAVSTGVTIPVAAAMGGIVGGALGMALSNTLTPEQKLAQALEKDKIQIVRIGEDYMLVLPSKIYFYPNSSHFNENMYPAIKDIAQFINLYDVETIKIAGYTNCQGNEYRNIALSREQAQTVLHELWYDGVKPSFMYSIGYGSQYPIAYNETAEGLIENNRIQITFRRLSVQS